jgi:plastocyanin
MDRRPRFATATAACAAVAIAAGVAVAPVLAADQAVTIAGFAFSPKTVTVNVGDSVTWTNNDGVAHTATGSGFNTGNIASGASKTITFNSAGTRTYICTIHPTMTGTVVVRSSGGGTAPNTDMEPVDGSRDGGWLSPVLAIIGLVLIGGTVVVDRLLRRRSTP